MHINALIPSSFDHSDSINMIISNTLKAIDPEICVKNATHIRSDFLKINSIRIDLNKISKIYLIGVGKAVLPMALAVSVILEERIFQGILITKHENREISEKLNSNIRVVVGSHPIPSTDSVNATKQITEMLAMTEVNDLVIGLISGGGSALMTLPNEEIGLKGIQNITSVLLKCGATIGEMNTVRKHLDRIKGGGLLKYIHPAKSIHMILSDVVGDPLSMIASGPTTYDTTTFEDCLKIIQKYKIEDRVEKNIISYLIDGKSGLHEETIKEDNTILNNHKNVIIGNLGIAAEAARINAEKLGFKAKVLTTSLNGEARKVGDELANKLLYLNNEKDKHEKPICLIAGGETTVTIRGNGRGGRNQELALAAAKVLSGNKNYAFISFATDGEDGPTDAAGGFVTGETLEKGLKANLDADIFLKNNNAYEYLEKVGGLIRTGPTGTNVTDLILMFAF